MTACYSHTNKIIEHLNIKVEVEKINNSEYYVVKQTKELITIKNGEKQAPQETVSQLICSKNEIIGNDGRIFKKESYSALKLFDPFTSPDDSKFSDGSLRTAFKTFGLNDLSKQEPDSIYDFIQLKLNQKGLGVYDYYMQNKENISGLLFHRWGYDHVIFNEDLSLFVSVSNGGSTYSLNNESFILDKQIIEHINAHRNIVSFNDCKVIDIEYYNAEECRNKYIPVVFLITQEIIDDSIYSVKDITTGTVFITVLSNLFELVPFKKP